MVSIREIGSFPQIGIQNNDIWTPPPKEYPIVDFSTKLEPKNDPPTTQNDPPTKTKPLAQAVVQKWWAPPLRLSFGKMGSTNQKHQTKQNRPQQKDVVLLVHVWNRDETLLYPLQ